MLTARKPRKTRAAILKFIAVPVVAVLLAISWFIYDDTTTTPQITHVSSEDMNLDFKTGELRVNGNTQTDTIPRVISANPSQIVTYESPVISTTNKPNAVALNWNQSSNEGAQIEMRTKNGSTWTEWRKIEADQREGKENTEANKSILAIADSIEDIQYRLTLSGSKTDPSATVDLSQSSLSVIDSRSKTSASQNILQQLGSVFMPKVSASTSQPRIISRAEWGSPEPNSSEWTPTYHKLNRVIVHHTATGESSDSYADVRAIWQYHARNLGWGDIGYNYIIDSKGNIFQGRYYDHDYARRYQVEVQGGHAYYNNENTVGISLIGDYRYKTLSDPAYTSLSQMIGYKLAPYRIDPAGTGPLGDAVVGHYQVGQTSCPGTNVISQMDRIKRNASDYYKNYLPYFIFHPLDSQRWMKVAKQTNKYNADTLEKYSTTLQPGTELFFIDKFEKNGIWYLRTEWDWRYDTRQGIPITDLEDIQPIALPQPEWRELTRPMTKYSPILQTDSPIDLTVYEAGRSLKFSSKITLGGKDYYRTEWDTTHSAPWYLDAPSTTPSTFKPFEQPRYMQVKAGAALVNPFSGQVTNSYLQSAQTKFTSKIRLDQTYYRTEADSVDNKSLAIPSSAIEEIPYQPLNEIAFPVSMKLTEDAQKYIPSQEVALPTIYPAGMIINFTHKITVNGKDYLRTEWDTTYSNNLGFPADKLSPVAQKPIYVPLDNPRTIKTKVDTSKVNLITMEPDTSALSASYELRYTTKTYIGGKWYLRTEWDTTNNLDKGVLIDNLET